MAVGHISQIPIVQCQFVAQNTTDISMQMYVKDKPAVYDLGYVGTNRKTGMWLYNGTDVDSSITGVLPSGEFSAIVYDLTVPRILRARTGVYVEFDISMYGPLNITAVYQFISTCQKSPTFGLLGTRPEISLDQPRPVDLSTAMEEAYAQAGEGYTIYDTLEFESNGASDKVMIVYSDEELITPQGVFIPCKFDCTLPETEASVRGQMKISVGFLPREAQIWLKEASQSRGRITVKWRQYLGENIGPDAEYPIPLEVVSVEQTATGASATALFPDLVNMPFPRRVMTTSVVPGGMM